ncbi:MAG: hypothetical protein AAGA90_07875 [Actinomycetota bacterium]
MIAAVFAASCGTDQATTDTSAGAPDQTGERSAVAGRDSFPEIALISGIDNLGFELACPPGDVAGTEYAELGALTVADLERDFPWIEPRDAMSALNARYEANLERHPEKAERIAALSAGFTVVQLPATTTTTAGLADQSAEERAAAQKDGSDATPPEETLPTPTYPTTQVDGQDSSDKEQQAEEPPAPDPAEELEWTTIVFPLDPADPTGPYLARAEVVTIGGKYSEVVELEECGTATRSLEDQQARRAADPDAEVDR